MTEANEKPQCCGAGQEQTHAGHDAAEVDARLMRAALQVAPADPEVTETLRARLKPVPGGIFEMGTRKSLYPQDLDSPRRKVRVSPFLIAPHAVTNADFSAFVEQTGYRTVAEQEGWSYVFHLLLDAPERWPERPPGTPWWHKVEGAYWRAPEGPGSDVASRADHPVVQIAWYDAVAYARWAGLRLPREAEWERAARGGLKNAKFPWGNQMTPGGAHAMNTFQGEFPHRNTGEDGWIGTAPVNAFRPNGYGLWNMTGNVWEWVQDYYGERPACGRLPERDPEGPATGFARVQRGGSYLCHESYCDRYHVHSRTRNDPDSAAGNAGFRVADDIRTLK